MAHIVRLLILTLMLSVGFAVPAGLAAEPAVSSLFDQKIDKELFPQPYERMLDGYVFPEDRLLALFRCLCTARADSRLSMAAHALERAIGEMMRTQSALFRQDLLAAADPKQRMEEWLTWWAKSAVRPETAAFAPLFHVLKPEEKKRLGLEELEKESLHQENELFDPDYVEAYASTVSPRHHYSRQICKVYWWKGEVKDALEQLLARVKFAFSSENVIRYLARARVKAQDPLLQQTLANLQEQLTRSLIDEIVAESRIRIENGLHGSEITFIGLTKSNQVMIKESLLRGRLHLLVKRVQLFEARVDRQIFEPILEQIGRRLENLVPNAPEAARAYLAHVRDTLQMVALVKLSRMERDEVSEDERMLFKQVGEYLTTEDKDGLLRGVAREF